MLLPCRNQHVGQHYGLPYPPTLYPTTRDTNYHIPPVGQAEATGGILSLGLTSSGDKKNWLVLCMSLELTLNAHKFTMEGQSDFTNKLISQRKHPFCSSNLYYLKDKSVIFIKNLRKICDMWLRIERVTECMFYLSKIEHFITLMHTPTQTHKHTLRGLPVPHKSINDVPVVHIHNEHTVELLTIVLTQLRANLYTRHN